MEKVSERNGRASAKGLSSTGFGGGVQVLNLNWNQFKPTGTQSKLAPNYTFNRFWWRCTGMPCQLWLLIGLVQLTSLIGLV